MYLKSLAALLTLAGIDLSGTVVHAQEACGQWHASVSRLAGEGEAMNARTCSEGTGPASDFEISCSGSELNLRFMPRLAGDYVGEAQDFLFSAGSASRLVFLGFEGLDGAFATNLDPRHPIFEMMKAGAVLTVSDPRRVLSDYRIALSGSRKALDTVIASCN